MEYRSDTLCGLFHNQALRFGPRHAFLTGRYNADGSPAEKIRSMSWEEARGEVLGLARGLMALGVKKGDRIVMYAESRPRWVIADQAIQACGAVGVPVYPTVSLDELAYMVENSGARVVIASTAEKAHALKKAGIDGLLAVITMGPADAADARSFDEIAELGRQVDFAELDRRLQAVEPEDICSIIYTSGTTGRPKGVVLTQANWVANMLQVGNADIFRRQNELELHLKAMVHLPLCHVYGRTGDYHVVGLYFGGELAFAESFSSLADDIREIRPNVITSIPRFYEKVYDIVNSSVARSSKMQRLLFRWAMTSGGYLVDSMATGRRMNPLKLGSFALANMLVFDRLKQMLGMDRVVFAISGGGKLSRDVCTFFRATSMQLNEGYGLTETAPVINFNEPELIIPKDYGPLRQWLHERLMNMTVDLMVTRLAQGKSPYRNPISLARLGLCYYSVIHKMRVKPGFVGRPVVWTEEKLADDGEVLVRGPQVFRTYWNMPEATAEVFTPDGWFKTGDIGRYDGENFLEITDRKKELFVTSGGKNIAPHPIEVALVTRPFIDQVCLVGDGCKYINALIVPDFETIRRHLRQKGQNHDGPDGLAESPVVRELIQKQVDTVNAALARYEQIKYFAVLKEPFSEETGELTPSLKMKRRVITEKYKDVIAGMY